MTVLELIKESQRMLGDIEIPAKYFQAISAPVAAVYHNLGIVIETIEKGNQADQEGTPNEDTVQGQDV